jgi:excinuclease ABC subunit B
MKKAMGETERRREIQTKYNIEHNITPASIKKRIMEGLGDLFDGNPASQIGQETRAEKSMYERFSEKPDQIDFEILKLRKKMKKHSENLEFEDAAKIRDEIKRLQILQLNLKSGPVEQESEAIQDGTLRRA